MAPFPVILSSVDASAPVELIWSDPIVALSPVSILVDTEAMRLARFAAEAEAKRLERNVARRNRYAAKHSINPEVPEMVVAKGTIKVNVIKTKSREDNYSAGHAYAPGINKSEQEGSQRNVSF